MSLNFPNNPSINDIYTVGNFAWIWTGSAWKKYPNSATDIGAELAELQSDVAELQTDKADLNSPTFTGYVEFDGIVDFTESVVIGIDALPNQTNQSGKYLTTDGTDASWAEIPVGTPHPFSMMG